MEIRDRVIERVNNMFEYIGVGEVPGIPGLVANITDVIVGEALAEIAARWDTESRDWYYDNRHTHGEGIDYVAGFEDGWDHAAQLLLRERPEHGAPVTS